MRKTITFLLAFLVATAAHAQAVSFGVHKTAVGGIRNTNPNQSVTFTPFWFDGITDTVDPPSSLPLTKDEAFSLDLSTLCKIDIAAVGTKSYSKTAGSYPTGINLAGSTLSGTPTVVESQAITLRCTFTPDVGAATTDDWNVTLAVTSPDVTAPTVPTNVVAAPSVANPTTELTVTWTASTDGTGVDFYTVASSDDEASCTALAQNNVNVSSPTVTTTRSGLSASSDYWFKVKATDLVGNASAYSACVQGITATPSGGGSGTPLLVDAGFENYAAGTNLITALPDAVFNDNIGGAATLDVVTTHAREGTRSMHSKIVKSGTTNYRSEVVVKPTKDIVGCVTSPTMWTGVSIYIAPAANTNTRRVIFQSHTVDGNSGHSPVLGLRYRTNLFQMTREVGTNSGVTFANLSQGVWHDFVFAIKCRHDNTGFIHIWQDGVQVVDFNNLQTGWEGENFEAYWKMGAYPSQSNIQASDPDGTVWEQWHDALRVCYSNACVYDDVAPRGNRLTAP